MYQVENRVKSRAGNNFPSLPRVGVSKLLGLERGNLAVFGVKNQGKKITPHFLSF
jgi:hypothetical protein